MIKESKPLTLAEARALLEKTGNDRAVAVATFLKKFTKLKPEKVQEIKKALEALDIIKLKEADIVKIIDFMPEDAEDLRKILTGSNINLDQNEIEKVLEALKKK